MALSETFYHPLLSNPIANDVHFQKYGHQWGQCVREIDLFAKTVAINAILACYRLCLCGRKISPSYGHRVPTAMDVSDDIEAKIAILSLRVKLLYVRIQHLKSLVFTISLLTSSLCRDQYHRADQIGLGIVRRLAA